MRSILCIYLGVILGIIIYSNLRLPSVIENRMNDLNLMRYDSKKEKFVPKDDSLKISKWDLYYIRYGIMKEGY